MADETESSDLPADETTHGDSSDSGAASKSGRGFRAGPLLIVAVVLALFAVWQAQRRHAREEAVGRQVHGDAADDASSDANQFPVRIIVEYGAGEETRLPAVPWRQGMTVLDAMQLIRERKPDFSFEYRGESETAMLTEIDNIANEGGQSGGKNWLFYVNDQLATQSFALQPVKGGDVILWKFEASK